ncbi:MAG: hypothetical protein IPN34_23200 [Planctomycetes bacterium]|nr:hypothetical protein [Planctomycetota bacterium]
MLSRSARAFRSLLLVCGVLPLAACSSDPEVRGETAEAYFARFETAMLSADVMKIEHSLVASDEEGSARAVWEGRFLAIDKPLEVRLDGRGSFGAQPIHLEIEARGEAIRATGGPKAIEQQLTGNSIDRWVRGFTRLGLAHDLWRVARGLPLLALEGGDQEISMQDLRFEGRERIGGVPARVLAYRAVVGGMYEADMRLWLDERTGHPLQRRATVRTRSLRLRTTESYRVLELAVIPQGLADQPLPARLEQEPR